MNLDLDAIAKAIKKWDNTRKDVAAMQALFSIGNSFTFNYPPINNINTETFLHSYLGVITNSKKEDVLKLFIIESDRDTKKQHESPEGLLPYINVIDINVAPPKSSVPEDEAKERILKWETSKNEWIAHQVQMDNIIPQIYAIPTRYLTTNPTYHAFFALNKKQKTESSTDISNYKGDMIIWDTKDGSVTYPREVVNVSAYFNTVRLIPPFGDAQKNSEADFFLLELANTPE